MNLHKPLPTTSTISGRIRSSAALSQTLDPLEIVCERFCSHARPSLDSSRIAVDSRCTLGIRPCRLSTRLCSQRRHPDRRSKIRRVLWFAIAPFETSFRSSSWKTRHSRSHSTCADSRVRTSWSWSATCPGTLISSLETIKSAQSGNPGDLAARRPFWEQQTSNLTNKLIELSFYSSLMACPSSVRWAIINSSFRVLISLVPKLVI